MNVFFSKLILRHKINFYLNKSQQTIELNDFDQAMTYYFTQLYTKYLNSSRKSLKKPHHFKLGYQMLSQTIASLWYFLASYNRTGQYRPP